MSAFQSVNNLQGVAQPYINTAAGYAQQGAAPVDALSSADINRYYNPYQQQVVNATLANINETNAQQQQQVAGNATLQGALGGDRRFVAQAELARQQGLASNQTLANLQAQGFNTATGIAQSQQANQQQNAARAGQAAFTYGSLGQEALGTGLQGAQAQLGTGGLQQGLGQSQIDYAKNLFYQQQAYPFQTLGWEAGVLGGLGGVAGGTSSTTGPAPNPLNQLLGLGVTAAGAYAGAGKAPGGRVGYDDGGFVPGVPYGGSPSLLSTPGYVPPPMQGGFHSNIPAPPKLSDPNSNSPNLNSMMQGAGAIGKYLGARSPSGGAGEAAVGDSPESIGLGDGFYEGAAGADIAAPEIAAGGAEAGADLLPLLLLASRGGRIGFAAGGAPDGNNLSDDLLFKPDINDAGFMPGADRKPDVEPVRGGIFGGMDYKPVGWPDAPITDAPMQLAANENAGPPADAPSNTMTANDERGVGPPLSLAPPAPGIAASEPTALNPNGGAAQAPGQQPDQAQPSRGGLIPKEWSGPLLRAGLSIMASRSPWLGVAAGEGGLAGLDQYALQKKEKTEQQKVLSDAEYKKAHVQSLKDQALRSQRQLDITEKHYDTTAAEAHQYHQDTVGQRQQAAQDRADYQRDVIDERRRANQSNEDIRRQATELKLKQYQGGLMDDDVAKFTAQQYAAGDKGALANLSRGQASAENIVKVRGFVQKAYEAQGLTGADLAAKMASYTSQTAGARTAAVRAANVESSVEEAKATFPLGLQASAAVPRTQFVPYNRAVQMVQRGTSSPELAKFVTANQGIITAYAQAMSRTGVNTVHAQQSAENLLSTATSHEAYAGVLDQMGKEMQAALVAPETVRQAILARISGRAPQVGGAPVAPSLNSTEAGAPAPLAPKAPAKRVRQGGHIYEEQPDGSMKAIE